MPKQRHPICEAAMLLTAAVFLLTAENTPLWAEGSAADLAEEAGPIVAEVHSRRISKADLQDETLRLLGNELSYFKEKQLHALQKSILDRMVERELLLLAAREWLEDDADQQGDDALLSRYLQQVVLSKSTETAADIEAYYEDASTLLTIPDELEVREIVLLFPESNHALHDKNRLQQELERIRKELLASPQRFSEFARKQSNARSAARGGLRGFLTLSQLEPEVAEVAADLEVNELSPIVESSRGFHLLRIEQIRKAAALSEDERRERVEALLDERLRSERLTEHLRELRRRYKVIVYLN